MEIIVSGRQLDVDAPLRAYAEAKVAPLTAEYGKLTSVRLVLSEERGRHIAEGHVCGKHVTLNASARAQTAAEAVDEVFDKLERQLRKHVERIHDHRAIPLSEAERLDAAAEATVSEGDAEA